MERSCISVGVSPKVISKFITYNVYLNILYNFFANIIDIHSNDVKYNYVTKSFFCSTNLLNDT